MLCGRNSIGLSMICAELQKRGLALKSWTNGFFRRDDSVK